MKDKKYTLKIEDHDVAVKSDGANFVIVSFTATISICKKNIKIFAYCCDVKKRGIYISGTPKYIVGFRRKKEPHYCDIFLYYRFAEILREIFIERASEGYLNSLAKDMRWEIFNLMRKKREERGIPYEKQP